MRTSWFLMPTGEAGNGADWASCGVGQFLPGGNF